MGFVQKDYSSNEILITTKILGYRQWYWKDNKLSSLYQTYWNNGSHISKCQKSVQNQEEAENHGSPRENCTCGIYAHYLPLESYDRKDNVFGTVEASGKIIMGTKGFRAEKVRITSLSGFGTSTQWFETAEKTRGIYPEALVDFCTSIGVPYFPTVKQMIHEFPQEDLSSLGVSTETLDSWRSSRNLEKTLHDTHKRLMEERLKDFRSMEQTLFIAYGITPSDRPGSASYRMTETMKHLGGF